MDSTVLRIGIAIAGVLLLAAIYFFGRPRKPGQGRRVTGFADASRTEGERIEPTLGAQLESELAGDGAGQPELDLAGAESDVGRRGDASFEKIVTLYVAARAGQVLRGSDIVVAAEKAGLTYGHMQIFHRLVEGHPERGPVFSVANIKKPGSFDMATIQELETPAIAFFLTSFAVWDAGSPVVADYGRIQSGLGSTKALVHQMEQTLPAGAMVFQYPVNVYPEAGPLHRMEDYDGFRPYLVSEQLRWSYGATKGRPTGDWQQKVPKLPVADALRGLAGYGFEGVLVDRFGYEPTALAAFERDLARVTGAAPVVSADGRYTFWDLRGYTQRLGATPDQLAARAERLFGAGLPALADG